MQWRQWTIVAAVIAALVGPPAVFSSIPSAIQQCRPALPDTSLVGRANMHRPPPKIPVMLDEQPLINPEGLELPDGLRILSPRGASRQSVMLLYRTLHLLQVREQVGPNFHGFALLGSDSVPPEIRRGFVSDAEFFIGPHSCWARETAY